MRVGLIAAQERLRADHSRATSHTWLIRRRAPGVGDHVEHILSSVGKSPGVIARAEGAEGVGLMQEATDDTRRLGNFGARPYIFSYIK